MRVNRFSKKKKNFFRGLVKLPNFECVWGGLDRDLKNRLKYIKFTLTRAHDRENTFIVFILEREREN